MKTGELHPVCESSCGGAAPYKVVHIHPTLRCNLFCKHCYSSSAPNLKGGLPLDLLKPFLAYLFEQGFNVVSVSGGEPFLYQELPELLRYTRSLGYRNQLASNGMLLKSQKAQACLDDIDLIAVSVDGNRAVHDDIRGQEGAFDKMVEGLQLLKARGKNFGIIHTVTNASWGQLLWLADFAAAQGAKLLQLHPLEMYGRAKEMLFNEPLSQENLHRAYIIGHHLREKYQGQMHIQMDFLHRDYILEHPETVYYRGEQFGLSGANFAEYMDTIIIDEKGAVYPVSYGFSSEFRIGELAAFRPGDRWLDIFARQKGPQLYGLLAEAYHEIVADQENDLVAWTEYIVAKSSRSLQLCA